MLAIAQQNVSPTRVIVWNALGSIANALSSFFFLAFVTQTLGKIAGDAWAICFSIAALLWTIGEFAATNYFATDATNRFTSEQYCAFKILSVAAMLVFAIFYVATFQFAFEKCVLALVLCVLKAIDAFGGYWYAAFQKVERLDISGFSLFTQMALTLSAFALSLCISHQLLLAAMIATAVEALWVFIFNPLKQRKICPIAKPDFNWPQLRALFMQLLPLFLASYMSFYLGNMPKYTIESIGGSGMQTDFNILFMPAFITNLFMVFVLRPVLTPLSKYWAKKDIHTFFTVIVKLLAICLAVTAGVVLLGFLCGVYVLEFFYGVDLSGCEVSFAIVLLGGGLVAACNVFYDMLIIMRKQLLVVVGYGLTIAIGIGVVPLCVQAFGLFGATLSYLLLGCVLFASFSAIMIMIYRKVRSA